MNVGVARTRTDRQHLAVYAENMGVRFQVRHHHPTVHSAIVRFLKGKPSAEEFWALRNVSFRLRHGLSLGIIGANGSGKSTLLRVLSRVYQPDEGQLLINGRVSSLISLGAGFHPMLTGIENIEINATLLGLTSRQIASRLDSIVEFADIGDFINAPVRTYSSGMRTRLAFSVAVHVDPQILVLDEVLSVGDAAFRMRSGEKMRELFAKGTTVVMVQHNMPAIVELCHRVIWLENGRIRQRGKPIEVVNAYLESRGVPPLKWTRRADGSRTVSGNATG